jgi:hypothetical protein
LATRERSPIVHQRILTKQLTLDKYCLKAGFCTACKRKRVHAVAIIPLGRASRRDSSSLPEGSPLRQLAPSPRERARLRERSHRAGPALPSYLALHHAGFSRLPILLPGRWALTPPFHPCLTNQLVRAVSPAFSKTSRRFSCAMPPCCFAGGIFSVALSVTEPHRIGLNPTPHAEACNSGV